MSTPALDRRTALRRLALGGAATLALPAWVEALTAFTNDHAHAAHAQAARRARTAAFTPKVLTPAQNATVTLLSERIIPQTDTPGARAAKVNEFIDAVLAEAPAAQRDAFISGLAWVDARSTRDFSVPFVKATVAQQSALLTAMAAPEALSGADQDGAAFFLAIKAMTLTGFYTSEIGLKELGDDGQLFFAAFQGCTHPEHQA